MGQTTLIGTDYYCDMICSGKKLFLIHGFLPKDVTKYVRDVEIYDGGTKVQISKVAKNSCIGSILMGPLGALIGAVGTSPRQLYNFRVFFEPGLPVGVLDVKTTDKYLEQWLIKHVKGSVQNGSERDFI